MSKVRLLLRYVRWTFERMLGAIEGEHQRAWRKLKKSGRLIEGRHNYSIPLVKYYVHDETKLHVGNYSPMSETAIVMLGGEHEIDWTTTFPLRIHFGLPGAGQDGMPRTTGDTHIGSDVWMGQRAFVRSGVTIGDGAIIASNANVLKDVPPYAIVGGNPARVIRYRHTEEQREALLEIKWWDWPDDEVVRATPLLCQPDIDLFIAYARARFPQGPGGPIADVPAPTDDYASAPHAERVSAADLAHE